MTERRLKRHGFGGRFRFIELEHHTMVPVWGPDGGGARARAARWKISMMTIRPPQQGHGGRRSGGEAASSASGRARASSNFRACAFAAGAGEEAVVTDAVEAL